MLEARPYGPDLTAAEREAILARVTQPTPGVIAYHELVIQTPFTIELCFERVMSLCEGQARVCLALDLIDIERPDAETRATLRRCSARFTSICEHAAVAVGANLVIAALAKLLMYMMGYRSISVHTTWEDALTEATRRRGP